MKNSAQHNILNTNFELLNSKQYPKLFRNSDFVFRIFSQKGFSSLAVMTVLGLFLAAFLALVGTGAVKLPGNRGIPVSPIPFADPVEDDQACNDPYNADCEKFLNNDPENLTQDQIKNGD